MKPDNTETPATASAAPPLWLGMDALAASPEFQAAALNEFPEGATEFTDEPSRRRFLALMGASLALSTGVGCNIRPAKQRLILPYTTQPDELTPGLPLFFASAFPIGGYGQGVLVRSNEGRPTKIEGNPDHPSSLGGAGVHMLASVLDLYDPDRSRGVTRAASRPGTTRRSPRCGASCTRAAAARTPGCASAS
jgi:molybdopterin-containing oxidoreductase family iron-sulfur binding subunit